MPPTQSQVVSNGPSLLETPAYLAKKKPGALAAALGIWFGAVFGRLALQPDKSLSFISRDGQIRVLISADQIASIDINNILDYGSCIVTRADGSQTVFRIAPKLSLSRSQMSVEVGEEIYYAQEWKSTLLKTFPPGVVKSRQELSLRRVAIGSLIVFIIIVVVLTAVILIGHLIVTR